MFVREKLVLWILSKVNFALALTMHFFLASLFFGKKIVNNVGLRNLSNTLKTRVLLKQVFSMGLK